MKNVHVFVSASFLYAVTKREFYYAQIYFQIKRIISSEKWRNYVLFFFFFENGKNLGRSDDGKWRKRRGWPYGKNVLRLYRETLIISKF